MSTQFSDPSLLLGTYSLQSFTLSVNGGQPQPEFGEAPRGYIVITRERFTAILTAERRKAGMTTDDKAALLDSLFAYSGRYTVDGQRLTTHVDVAWNEAWTGTDQVRLWSREGSQLMLSTEPMPDPRNLGKVMIGKLVWVKIE